MKQIHADKKLRDFRDMFRLFVYFCYFCVILLIISFKANKTDWSKILLTFEFLALFTCVGVPLNIRSRERAPGSKGLLLGSPILHGEDFFLF